MNRKITGTMINYYFHCKRHLWLFVHSIRMEENSETVKIGKFISENTYSREDHEIKIENDDYEIVIDFYDQKSRIIHEIKKSTKMEILHLWQLKFYIFVMKEMGINSLKGEINYPKLKQKISVTLDESDIDILEKTIEDIKTIINYTKPPNTINEPFCKQCSYYDLCYI